MRSFRFKLNSGAALPVILTAGIAIGGIVVSTVPVNAVTPKPHLAASLPMAKAKPTGIQLAACNPCNPCAAKNPCNPCSAKNPCNPCAASNPCNPCAAAAGSASNTCFVPRLKVVAACNPCAAKNPCNPCAAKNPCNPCAAANPCNPCAVNPCNPCGAGEAVELTAAEAKAVYDCLIGEMTAAYERAGLGNFSGFTGWTNVAAAPYQSSTHGNRYVNNYVNKNGAFRYSKFEDAGAMPAGTVVAKDSFVVNQDGSVSAGPLFVMEKVGGGFNEASGNWRYTMVMPNGSVAGMTKGSGAASVEFCNECHAAMAEDQDYLFFLPEESRTKG